MPSNSAEYQRAYRARKKAELVAEDDQHFDREIELSNAYTRIAELEEEVRHLKAELAARPVQELPHGRKREALPEVAERDAVRFNTQPFHGPIPKTGHRK